MPLIEMRFPPPGTLLTPIFPAPTNARTFVILRLLGVLAGAVAKAVDGRMPADQETIRYTGVYGRTPGRRTSCVRCSAAVQAAGTTPTARTPSMSCPIRGTCRRSSASRGSRSWSSGWDWPSTPGAPAAVAAGSATKSTSGCCATPISCRSRTARSCPAGAFEVGAPGKPFSVTIDPGGPAEREVDALADGEPVRAGEVIRIRTTGGGGWGDPLDRPYQEVLRDVQWCKVSIRGRQGLRRRRHRAEDRRGHRGRGRERRLRVSRGGRPAPATSRSSTADPGTPGCPAGWRRDGRLGLTRSTGSIDQHRPRRLRDRARHRGSAVDAVVGTLPGAFGGEQRVFLEGPSLPVRAGTSRRRAHATVETDSCAARRSRTARTGTARQGAIRRHSPRRRGKCRKAGTSTDPPYACATSRSAGAGPPLRARAARGPTGRRMGGRLASPSQPGIQVVHVHDGRVEERCQPVGEHRLARSAATVDGQHPGRACPGR